ncbi:MAG: PQQ-dependent sugar dehydrogenase [Actinomycetota bacterium]|nr:PQQ-dependent sugar dehydrogenase [Actinomycetota bacterium]
MRPTLWSRRTRRISVLAVAAALLVACADGDQPRVQPTEAASTAPALAPPPPHIPPPVAPPPLTLEPVADDLDFPLFLTAPRDGPKARAGGPVRDGPEARAGGPVPGDGRLFVGERSGRILILRGGEILLEPFLDISELTRTDGERGLLGLAFHPDYSRNGRLFLHYSGAEDGDTRLAEYHVSADPNRAEPTSARLLLTVEQPASNHNGGMVTFGPDGYLYLALGDGGGSGDRFNNGQNPASLLGSLLRLDVDRSGEGGRAYAIPPDNPFAGARSHGGVRGAPEVWAYGLRNPWRLSFDHEADLIYIADVGQNAWEEINIAPTDAAGLNYGWPILEGSRCFRPRQGCSQQGLILPVLEYEAGDGNCGVIGGYVYRGTRIPALAGTYFYGELCGGWVRSFRYKRGSGPVEARDYSDRFGELGRIVSFGQDAAGELYILSADGTVHRISSG